MEYLIQWISNILIFVLFAVLVDMLLPNSNLKRYTKMVTGLLLITIILSPLFRLVSQDIESALGQVQMDEWSKEVQTENLFDTKKTEIQASQRAYMLEQMAVQLKKSVQGELRDEYGVEIADMQVEVAKDLDTMYPEDIESMTIQLTPYEENSETQDTVEVIEIVDIDTGEPKKEDTQTVKQIEPIRDWLQSTWGMEGVAFNVYFEGEGE
ncbi:stage III sporulation protein AF [Bacillus fonticola]|uniref:stage III sporulation protein AF n=1 Tax=Bacillus fonticola TaxID=2728853 RepID=UPI001473EDC8|nr:stage III sporulation protein AF [Bacillus fonticola]